MTNKAVWTIAFVLAGLNILTGFILVNNAPQYNPQTGYVYGVSYQ